jgi:phage terminase small subunit
MATAPMAVKATPEAAKEWRRLARIVRDVGLDSPAYMAMFAAYCLLWADVATGKADLKTFAELRQVCSHLGLTPASAGRVNAAKTKDGKDSDQEGKLASFLRAV